MLTVRGEPAAAAFRTISRYRSARKRLHPLMEIGSPSMPLMQRPSHGWGQIRPMTETRGIFERTREYPCSTSPSPMSCR